MMDNVIDDDSVSKSSSMLLLLFRWTIKRIRQVSITIFNNNQHCHQNI